jgi:hypothetical protein
LDLKGKGMMVSALFGLISSLCYFGMLRHLSIIRKSKDDKYLSTLVFLSALYLAFARLIESFYIVSESDLRGIVYGFGNFYIPLDIMAMAMYFIFVFDVFITKSRPKDLKMQKILTFIFYISSILAVAYFGFYFVPKDSPIKIISNSLSMVLLGIIFVLEVFIVARILNLRSRVEENKDALGFIGFQLVGFGIMMILLLFSSIFSQEINYIFRAIKNCAAIFHSLAYYFAFIKPYRLKEIEK